MPLPFPERRPCSGHAVQPNAGDERPVSNQTAPIAGASGHAEIPPGLRELAEHARVAGGVPPRSPEVVFAAPGSPSQSQHPGITGAAATPASTTCTITSLDDLHALLDSPQSETVDTLIVEGALEDRDFSLFPRSVRHVTLDIEGVTPAALAYLEALALRSLTAHPRTQVGDDGAIVLGQHPTLESVILTANRVGDRGAQGLSRSATLRSADLSENCIGDRGGVAFAQSTLKTMLFYDNELSAKTAAALIRESRAIALAFGGNPIRDPSEIAFEVSRNTRLKFFDVTNCRVGNAELGAIATNRSIEALVLDGNLFDISGLQMLAPNRMLRSLKVADNDRLRDDSAILLSRMTWLEELDVGDIEFGVDGFLALAVMHRQGVRVVADWPEGLP